MPTETTSRRPLKTRDWSFFQKLAAGLALSGVTPNAISFASIVFGGLAGGAFVATAWVSGTPQRACWLGAAAFIQFRLIANLLDGMVAVEGGKGGPTGELWNEAPDRVADALIFIGAGYAAGSAPILGWGAALVAVFVAYVRVLGASVGAGQLFLGPMAKQHRMALLTFAAVLSAVILPSSDLELHRGSVMQHGTDSMISHVAMTLNEVLPLALLVVVVGGCVTAFRRLRRIAAFLRSRPPVSQ
jgi:phosphatidylglycerophosphate synthase